MEALTRQLEELRRDRRGPLNLISDNTSGDGHNGQQNASPAALELDKLRRELMVISTYMLLFTNYLLMVHTYINFFMETGHKSTAHIYLPMNLRILINVGVNNGFDFNYIS